MTVELWRCAETGDAMAVGYSEKWLAEGRHRRLVDAGLRFFYRSGLGDGSDLVQVLRFEWADALLKGGSQEFSFPGKGAGTPHWHYDGLEADRAVRELVVLRQLFEAGGAVPPQGEDGSVVKGCAGKVFDLELFKCHGLAGWMGRLGAWRSYVCEDVSFRFWVERFIGWDWDQGVGIDLAP